MTNAEAAPSHAGSRHERRRQRTRAALVEAATDLLGSVGPDVSIQAITERADVGLGSFYNYFRDKQDIFRAAADEAMVRFEADTVRRARTIEDPLERFAAAVRMYGRLPDSHPRLAPAIITEGELTLQTRQEHVELFDRVMAGLGTDAMFRGDVLSLRTSFFISSLRLVMRLRLTDPDFGDDETDTAAEYLLILVGVDPDEAHRVCRLPLPPAVVAA